MTTYDKPTYKQYDNNTKQWQEWKRQAHEIRLTQGLSEVRRHASVSLQNAHKCHDCFCCACVEYVREQKETAS